MGYTFSHECGATCVGLCGSIHSRRVLPHSAQGGVAESECEFAEVASSCVHRLHPHRHLHPTPLLNITTCLSLIITTMPTPEECGNLKAQAMAKMERAWATLKEMERAKEEEKKQE